MYGLLPLTGGISPLRVIYLVVALGTVASGALYKLLR